MSRVFSILLTAMICTGCAHGVGAPGSKGRSEGGEASPRTMPLAPPHDARPAGFVEASFTGKKTTVKLAGGSCETINAAIRGLPAGGGTVRLTKGTYYCEEPIVIDRDNVKLIGAGVSETLIKLADYAAVPVVVIGALETETFSNPVWGVQHYPSREVNNIYLGQLAIDGNKANQNKSVECFDFAAKESRSCAGDGGRFIRNNGIDIRRAAHVTVQKVKVEHAISGGLVTEKLSRALLVDTFWSSENTFDGIAGYETTNSLFRNVHLQNQPYSGLSVEFGFENNAFIGLTSQYNRDNGIFTSNMSNNTFRDVIVKENKNWGIFIEGRNVDNAFQNGSCDGLVFDNLRVEGNGNGPLRVNDPCRGVRLKKATIQSGDSSVPCISKDPGAVVEVIGKYVCR